MDIVNRMQSLVLLDIAVTRPHNSRRANAAQAAPG
jgi:hypothetical protein